jgi:tRNA (guanosine-2'-O-)-methyltransferase
LPDGPLQIVVAWEPADADVDLEVFDPAGERAMVGQPTSLGLVKDRNCPREPNECGGQNVEVVYLARDWIPEGRYLVSLRLVQSTRPEKDVSLRFGGHIGNEPLSGSFTFSSSRTEAHLELIRMKDARSFEP